MADPDYDPEDAARELLASGTSAIESIKAIRERFSMPLGDAKAVVHRQLSPEQQQVAEALWDRADEVIELRIRADRAATEIRIAAGAFGAGEATIQEFWGSFHEHLYDLCGEHPLTGDWLMTFEELERWEVATGSNREVAVKRARAIALRLVEVP